MLNHPPRAQWRRSYLSVLVVLGAVAARASAAEPATGAALWAEYAASPNTHPNIPNCSFAGYGRSEKPLPEPKGVADVRSAGAKGEGTTDDTAAFAAAIDQAKAAGGGAVLVPAGTYRIDGIIHLKHDGVVLRGEGRAKTILNFPNALTKSKGPLPREGKSAWSWSGGMVWIGPPDTFDPAGKVARAAERAGQPAWEYWRPGPPLAAVQGSAAVGDTTVVVDSAAKLAPGALVLMTWDNPADFSLLKHIAGHPALDAYPWATAAWITPPALPQVRWPVEVAAVAGNRVTLRQPLRVAVRPEWKVRFEEIGPRVAGAGVEHLTIHCHAPMDHKHLTNQGHNALYVNRAYDCFVRDVEVQSAENGINVASSKNVTVRDVAFTGPEMQHHTLACRVMSHAVLFEQFVVDGPKRVKHGINIEWLSAGNVWRKGKMAKGTFDSHRALSFDSIRTDLTLANDADGAGGAGQAGPFLGKRIVHWNVRLENSPRKDPGELVFQPSALPSGALVGIQGAAPSPAPPPGGPPGPKGCVIRDQGHAPDPPDLFEAQLKLRLNAGKR